MNRFISTLVFLTMVLMASAICVRQSLAFDESFVGGARRTLLTAASVVGVAAVVIGFWLIRNELVRRGFGFRRRRFQVVPPLRRLFSTVRS